MQYIVNRMWVGTAILKLWKKFWPKFRISFILVSILVNGLKADLFHCGMSCTQSSSGLSLVGLNHNRMYIATLEWQGVVIPIK